MTDASTHAAPSESGAEHSGPTGAAEANAPETSAAEAGATEAGAAEIGASGSGGPVIAFLGSGSMNGAILRGVLASGVPAERVRATTRSADSAQALADDTGVQVFASESDSAANARAVEGADLVLLGVKPYAILELCDEIAEALPHTAVVASVAAGITLSAMADHLRDGQPVVRTMPNTPSSVGRGVISVTSGEHVSAEQLETVREVLSQVGTVVTVEEAQVRAVTGVSGSGPAYVFLLAEMMQKAGERLGLDADVARVLAKETVSGAGVLLSPEDADAESLRKAVTSPNGTTERAINTFLDGGIEQLVADAVAASANRGDEMEQEFCG
ncbi:pyrroline-5-carboxylate reductase [Kocuria sp.]|uniref:pyrroline-5-carboxylate reductase n=1 Tax=Kocuria sp. TaxID=1871328 RepID=UPI0026DF6D95|nr:pyrroline-5-carboxylate reductase [Kocuria sp.]MDO5618552.1 pyrroline-5-carboxylate reductase [Kocuria sp.]